MTEFRPASYWYKGGGRDGRDLDIIEVKIPRTKGGCGVVGTCATVWSGSLRDHHYNNYSHNQKSNKIVRRSKGSKNNRSSASSVSASSFSSAWNDPDKKRRTRVAKYKYYAVEGKVKSSIKKGLHWFKTKCSKLIHGL